MQARGKRVLAWTAVVLLVVGTAIYAVWNAPPPDLVPVAKAFFVELDEGQHLQALNGNLMQDRWDLTGLLEHTSVRTRRLGRLVQLEPAGPVEEVDLPPGSVHGRGKRMRIKGTFERGVNEIVFTFARRGSKWYVYDFEFPVLEPKDRQALEQQVRRIGTQVAEMLGDLRLPGVYERLVRSERIANPPEPWSLAMQAKLENVGPIVRVEERAWTYVDGQGTLAARLVFERAARDVDIDVRFDSSEGRVVVTRLAFLP